MPPTRGSLDTTLQNALQDRATHDTIRRVHLKIDSSTLLSSILSQLTAGSEQPRSSSVVSIILRYQTINVPVDISDFFTHYRFPKLQHLELYNCTVSSWDLIMSQTAVLTTLDLHLGHFLPSPNISQLISILASNPTLRKVSLSGYRDSDDGGGVNPSPRASLHHLKELKLAGEMQDVFGLINHLDHPRRMDHLDITLDDCSAEHISRLVGPYLQDHLQRRGVPQAGLGLSLMLPYDDTIVLHVGDVGEIDFSTPTPTRLNTFVAISVEFDERACEDLRDTLAFDLIAHTPQEEIIYFQAYGKPVAMEHVSARLPNLRGLHFEGTSLPAVFPRVNSNREGEIYPSLQYVLLDWVFVDCGDWSPLTIFLNCRATSGNRLNTLVIVGSHHVGPPVRRYLEEVVQEFAHLDPLNCEPVCLNQCSVLSLENTQVDTLLDTPRPDFLLHS